MTDALVPVDVAALERMPLDQRVDAIGEAYRGWRCIEVAAAWTFGRALRSIRGNYSKGSGDWGAVLDRIGIEHSRARRYMQIADGHDAAEIARYLTVDAAVKALRAAPEPTPAPVEPEPEPTPAAPVEPVEAAPAAVVEAVAAEATPTAAELREERLERLAIITEDIDGPVVEVWAAKFDRQAAELRDAVRAGNEARKATAAERRKHRDVCDALLEIPVGDGDAGINDVLAKFYGCKRKAAA